MKKKHSVLMAFLIVSIFSHTIFYAQESIMPGVAPKIDPALVIERQEAISKKVDRDLYIRYGIRGVTALFIAYHIIAPFLRSESPHEAEASKKSLGDGAGPVSREEFNALHATVVKLAGSIHQPWFSLPWSVWFSKQWWRSIGYNAATACNYALTMVVVKHIFESIVDILEAQSIHWFVNQRTTCNTLFEQAIYCGNSMKVHQQFSRGTSYEYDIKTMRNLVIDLVDQVTLVIAYMHYMRDAKMAGVEDELVSNRVGKAADEHIAQLILMTETHASMVWQALEKPDAYITVSSFVEQWKVDMNRIVANFARWEKSV